MKYYSLARFATALIVTGLIGTNVWLATKNKNLESEVPKLQAQIQELTNRTLTPIPPAKAPAVTKVSPAFGTAGTSITITGSGFLKNSNVVHIDWGIIPDVGSSDGITLTFIMPDKFLPECAFVKPACALTARKPEVPGHTYSVFISNMNGHSEAIEFLLTKENKISKAVSLSELKPIAGRIATVVTVTGKGFLRTGNTIVFGYHEYTNVSSKDGKTLSFAVPAALIFPCKPKMPCPTHNAQPVVPGPYSVYVYNSRGASNILTFTVTE